MCCNKLKNELNYGERFEKDEYNLYLKLKTYDYDEDYGHDYFTQKIIINYCPFCGFKYK
jgi:hypothetical protein